MDEPRVAVVKFFRMSNPPRRCVAVVDVDEREKETK